MADPLWLPLEHAAEHLRVGPGFQVADLERIRVEDAALRVAVAVVGEQEAAAVGPGTYRLIDDTLMASDETAWQAGLEGPALARERNRSAGIPDARGQPSPDCRRDDLRLARRRGHERRLLPAWPGDLRARQPARLRARRALLGRGHGRQRLQRRSLAHPGARPRDHPGRCRARRLRRSRRMVRQALAAAPPDDGPLSGGDDHRRAQGLRHRRRRRSRRQARRHPSPTCGSPRSPLPPMASPPTPPRSAYRAGQAREPGRLHPDGSRSGCRWRSGGPVRLDRRAAAGTWQWRALRRPSADDGLPSAVAILPGEARGTGNSDHGRPATGEPRWPKADAPRPGTGGTRARTRPGRRTVRSGRAPAARRWCR